MSEEKLRQLAEEYAEKHAADPWEYNRIVRAWIDGVKFIVEHQSTYNRAA